MSIKRQTVWSLLPIVTVTLVNILSVPLFYRFLGADMYAIWLYVGTLMGVFGFMDFGIGVAVARYVGVALGRGDHQAVREYWGTGNLVAIPLLGLMAAIYTALGVFLGPHWFNVDPNDLSLFRWSFVAGGLCLFLSYYSQFWLMLSQAYLDFRFLGILRTIISLMQVLPAVLLAWLTRNPLLIVYWTASVALIQLGVFVWHAQRTYSLGAEIKHASWLRAREMAAYTGKIFASLVVNAFAAADRLVLGRLAPAADFTHYSICANVGSRIQGVSVAVMGPVFSQTNRAVGNASVGAPAAVYNETFNFTFPWYVLLSVWTAVWHPLLLRLWLGPELAAATAPIFVPVVVGFCLAAVSNISTAQLGSLNRVGTGIVFSLGSACFLVVAIVIGWRAGGIIGVAWGYLASRGVLIAQDVFVSRVIGAQGWLSPATWLQISAQAGVGLLFSGSFLFTSRDSLWLLVPAVTHAMIIGIWLARKWFRDSREGTGKRGLAARAEAPLANP